ncbi:MAG TPA: hypothetical protein VGE58_12885 [Daejeonella sp.]
MIPEFMRKYYEGSNSDGKEAISKLAADYQEERRTFFETTFNEKQAFQRQWNRVTGEHRELSQEEAIAPIDYKYEEKAREVAMANGYGEKQQQEQEQAADHTPEQVKQEQLKEAKQEQREAQAAVKQAEQAQAAECKATRQEFLENLESMRQRQQEMRPKL